MTADRDQFTSTLDAVFRPGTNTGEGWRERTLLRLLAKGEPVTVEDLAAAQDVPVDDVRRALTTSPDIEYDAQGRIVGAGLTLLPTPHQFEIDGRQLYTWCAMDTLVYPRLLARPARVVSPCHATGTPIRLAVEESGVTSVDPATAVVSLVAANDVTSVRTAFCDQVHFFASDQAARPWLDNHPDATVLPVAEAYDLARDATSTRGCR